MELCPHLTFDGRCREAFEFYARTFSGTIATMMRYADSPMDVPAEWREKIIHATMHVGGRVLAGADIVPDRYERPQGFYVVLAVPNPQPVFDALAEGGNVLMPLQKTFWAESFGVVVDRFGIPWEITIG
jgi:PhnB protein